MQSMSGILDTRDLIEERDELRELAQTLDGTDQDRLDALEALLEELEPYGAGYGIQMIPESEFEDYAQQVAEDTGAINAGAQWPAYCIDWERAARDLAMDYSMISFDGTDYYWQEA